MKLTRKIRFYNYRYWNAEFKQITIIPDIVITYNPTGSFLEQGLYKPLWIFSISWLMWDLGVRVEWDFENEN